MGLTRSGVFTEVRLKGMGGAVPVTGAPDVGPGPLNRVLAKEARLPFWVAAGRGHIMRSLSSLFCSRTALWLRPLPGVPSPGDPVQPGLRCYLIFVLFYF